MVDERCAARGGALTRGCGGWRGEGSLLGVVAMVLIQKNRNLLVGSALPEKRVARVISMLEQVAVRCSFPRSLPRVPPHPLLLPLPPSSLPISLSLCLSLLFPPSIALIHAH